MALYLLGDNVFLEESTLMKILSVPKVYKVGKTKVLRWLDSGATAQYLYYGDDWASFIRDLPESFFPDYGEGTEITL